MDLSKLSNAELADRLLGKAKAEAVFAPGGEALLREAASRLQAPAVAEVEVKPLEWQHGCAGTPFGKYVVEILGPRICASFENMQCSFAKVDSPDAAQAVAEADYERRVRACLRTGGSE